MTHSGDITHLQLDGNIKRDQLKEAIEMAREACKEIYEVQKKALKDSVNLEGGK
jgi:ribonuclease PH